MIEHDCPACFGAYRRTPCHFCGRKRQLTLSDYLFIFMLSTMIGAAMAHLQGIL